MESREKFSLEGYRLIVLSAKKKFGQHLDIGPDSKNRIFGLKIDFLF